jgi:hypothetical protein
MPAISHRSSAGKIGDAAAALSGKERAELIRLLQKLFMPQEGREAVNDEE